MLEGMQEANQPLPSPIMDLQVGGFYRYNAEETPFSKPFIFEVIEDNNKHYVIRIQNSFESVLEKDFKLLEAFEDKTIFKVSGKWSTD